MAPHQYYKLLGNHSKVQSRPIYTNMENYQGIEAENNIGFDL